METSKAVLPLLLLIPLFCRCTPPGIPTSGGIVVTGPVTNQEAIDIGVRANNVRQCFRDNRFPIRGRLKELRVHATTCKQPRFRKGTQWVAGWSNEKDRAEVERRLIEVEHESAAVYYRDHGPRDHSNLKHPSMVCGEPLKRAWFRLHPRKACVD